MDVARNLSNARALDGDGGKKLQFFLNTGMTSSALEHSVPERMFSTPDYPAEGISAVKALQIANDLEIPIYHITHENIEAVLPHLELDPGVITDIRNAVNAGKVVTVSRTNISHAGWSGCGYIIIDPFTGAGAYMISGGINGAQINVFELINILMSIMAEDASAEEIEPLIAHDPIQQSQTYLLTDKVIETLREESKKEGTCLEGQKTVVNKDLYWACIVNKTFEHVEIYGAAFMLVLMPSPYSLAGGIVIAVAQSNADGALCRAVATKCIDDK